jgi:hypothetical protein
MFPTAVRKRYLLTFWFLSSDAGCTGAQAGPIRFPGISNLNDIGFNDKISSWKLVADLLAHMSILNSLLQVLLRVKGVLVRERGHGSFFIVWFHRLSGYHRCMV